VTVSPEAVRDLLNLYDYIADAASPLVAERYLARVETYLRGFEYAAARGTRRDDVRPGLRIVGFERRVTVAFAVADNSVTIFRLFYAGQEWSDAFEDQ
jgi:toxin ParE1/3/4